MEAEIIEIKPESKSRQFGSKFGKGAFAFVIGFLAEEGAKKAWEVGSKMIKSYRA